jgi:hypothetical protein
MRWTHLAAVFVACTAIECLAETPDWSGSRPQATPAMQQMFQGRLFSGQNWWNRYGEPVNATQLAQADPAPADNAVPAGPMAPYGDGYIYGPGSCDCSAPCIWNLWTGYVQWPKRCNPYGGHHGRRNCNDGCNSYSAFGSGGCGNSCGGGCGRNSCSTPVSCGCSTPASCGCSTPVTCTTAAPDCGCKPSCCKCRSCHLGNHWRCFTAHWNGGCNSCSAPVSCGCGCSTPAQMDMSSEKQALQGPPKPLPEEALLHPLPRLN